ncbi:MAG: alpha/beta fold hydrolase [Caldilineaceae bacterium]|nr:alpha/beta fold hydrolase [Caldilineaceae bacterium]
MDCMGATTILVPGFSDDERCMRGLARYLQRKIGAKTLILSPQPSAGQVGIDVLAGMLATQLDECLPTNAPVHLVGFSMGGLICRYYAQRLRATRPVEQLVTIATPHQGTWSAYSFARPACFQMRPGSQFLQELNADLLSLTTVQFTSIWTPFDLTVLPSTSSWLPVGQIVTILSPFHRTMLFDPRVFAAVSARLQSAHHEHQRTLSASRRQAPLN